MNKNRLSRIETLVCSLEDLRDELSMIKEEEQEYIDNAPDNLNCSARYEQAESNVDYMDEAYDNLDSLIENLREMIEEN